MYTLEHCKSDISLWAYKELWSCSVFCYYICKCECSDETSKKSFPGLLRWEHN